jgi:V/A-type H+-transporting ATPase subunit G/H
MGQHNISEPFKYHEYILVKPSGESPVGKAETLLQVRDAEAKAKQTLEQADEKQRNILAAARREAVERSQKAEVESKAKTESALAQERKALATKKAELLQKGNEDAAKIDAKVKERVPKAKQMIKAQFERTLDAATGTHE